MCVKDAQCHRARDALHKARDALHKARDALSRSHGVSFAHSLLHTVFCRASRVFCTRIYLVCLPPVSIVCVDLEPVEQTLYSATVPIKKSTHIYKVCRTPVSIFCVYLPVCQSHAMYCKTHAISSCPAHVWMNHSCV